MNITVRDYSSFKTQKLCPAMVTYPTPDRYGPFSEFYASNKVLNSESLVLFTKMHPTAPILIGLNFALININYLPIIVNRFVFMFESPFQPCFTIFFRDEWLNLSLSRGNSEAFKDV